MRKNTGEVRQINVTKIVCDECGQDVNETFFIGYDAHWSDGYDTYGNDADFCSLDCMLKFLEKNYGSQLYFPPDNQDITISIPTASFHVLLSKLRN